MKGKKKSSSHVSCRGLRKKKRREKKEGKKWGGQFLHQPESSTISCPVHRLMRWWRLRRKKDKEGVRKKKGEREGEEKDEGGISSRSAAGLARRKGHGCNLSELPTYLFSLRKGEEKKKKKKRKRDKRGEGGKSLHRGRLACVKKVRIHFFSLLLTI